MSFSELWNQYHESTEELLKQDFLVLQKDIEAGLDNDKRTFKKLLEQKQENAEHRERTLKINKEDLANIKTRNLQFFLEQIEKSDFWKEIEVLDLSGLGLTGQLDLDQIRRFTKLTTCRLNNNQLQGTISAEQLDSIQKKRITQRVYLSIQNNPELRIDKSIRNISLEKLEQRQLDTTTRYYSDPISFGSNWMESRQDKNGKVHELNTTHLDCNYHQIENTGKKTPTRLLQRRSTDPETQVHIKEKQNNTHTSDTLCFDKKLNFISPKFACY